MLVLNPTQKIKIHDFDCEKHVRAFKPKLNVFVSNP